MKVNEFSQRLRSHPLIATELVLASFMANLLALAVPVYVIQVLNRYLSYGVDATLVTLTIGVVLALLMEYAFRTVRLRLAGGIGEQRNKQLWFGAMGILTTAQMQSLNDYAGRSRLELNHTLDTIESAYGAQNLTALLDLPFALLFIAVLLLLSPTLGIIVALFIFLLFLFALAGQRKLREKLERVNKTTAEGRHLIARAYSAVETVRLFDRTRSTLAEWARHIGIRHQKKEKIARSQGNLQISTASLHALMGVVIYAVGAPLVIGGEFSVGVLIGANILASRALGPVIKFAQLGETLATAHNAMQELEQLSTVATEQDSGAACNSFSGQIQIKDLAFSYPNAVQPLYESLNLELQPGAVLLITGANGSGKTTLSRLLTGLLTPQRGMILVDGIDIRQLAPQWWRGQFSYLPQEPVLLQGSLKYNLESANPELNQQRIDEIISDAGLTDFIARSPDGLDMEVGNHLSLGYRKRIALARALAVDGKLVIFDDPTEGLDQEGRQTLYALLLKLSRQGRTLILCSDDPVLLQGASLILDLNEKPTPKLQFTGVKS